MTWQDLKGIRYEMAPFQGITENLPGWNLQTPGTALLVHDMQRYFLKKFDMHADPMRTALANIESLVDCARGLDLPVFYSAQPGAMTPAQRGLLSDFWGDGMSLSQSDRAIWPSISPHDEAEIVTKWRYSALYKNDLEEKLVKLGVKQLVLVGVYAHVGILSTAIDAYTRDLKVFILSDAVADFSATDHLLGLDIAKRVCSVVCSTTTAIALLTGQKQ